MAARKMKLESSVVNCMHCGEPFDLNRQSKAAQMAHTRDVACPNCGKKVGTLS